MKRGFTLIELLIVVAIIAILAAIAVPNFLEAQMRAKIVSVRSDMRNILLGMNAYVIDNAKYPPDVGGNWYQDYWSLHFLTTPVAYIASIPTNPFFDKKQSNSGLPSGGQAYRGNYSYWRNQTITNGKVDPDKSVDCPELGLRFAITSCGPDNTSQFGTASLSGTQVHNRGPLFVDTLYDPSNGTVSRGDMHMSNQGVTP